MTTQFSGESAWDAIVNDECLNIEEESQFLQFCKDSGIDQNSPLTILEDYYKAWRTLDRSG